VIHITGPYDIPNVKADSYAIATNTVPCGAFRGFGQPQVNFANESLMDDLAAKLDMDPAEIRKKNILKTGLKTSTGQEVGTSCGLEETLNKAIEKSRYRPRMAQDSGKIKRGMGIATTFYGVGLGAEGKYFAKSAAQVYVKEDGSVLVAIGNVEMGQGSETVFNRICADTLGCSYNMVDIMAPDTTRVPDSGPTVASRGTTVGGRAVLDASEKIRKSLINAAADKMGVRPFDITIENKMYKSVKGEMSYVDVVKEAYARRLQVAAQGWYRPEGTTFDLDTGLGDPYKVYTYSTNICEVAVDTETGQVKVTKFVSAHDIGKAIHRPSAEGQIQGGVVQGIGYALYENLCLEGGKILNPSFTGYAIPTSIDLCDVDPIIVESPYAEGPFGAKGLGEPPMIGAAAAIMNAIYDATGIRIRKTPCMPEDIIKALYRELK
jgi:CO/xanthine dehydrogenase Mo-binding subunit